MIEKLIPTAYARSGNVSIGGSYAFGNYQTLADAIQPLVQPMFAIAATIVFIYFIVGAFRMITSNGDKNIVASAREEMTHGIIGFIMLILLFLIVQYLPNFFFGKRDSSGNVQNNPQYNIVTPKSKP